MNRNKRWIVGVALGLFAGALAQDKKALELTKLSVSQDGGVQSLTMEASGELSPNIFKLADQDKIVVDLTDTKMGASLEGELKVNQGAIKDVTVNQFDHSGNFLTRVVISLSGPVDYNTQAQGNALSLRLTAIGGELPKTAQETPAAVEPAPQGQQFPADISPIPQEFSNTPTLAPLEGGFINEESKPALSSATELVNVQYAASATGTTISLVGNGPIESYDDFVLANPRRVVVDLNGLKNAYVGAKTITLNTPEVSKVRLGVADQRIRVVLDAKGKGTPSYTISKEGSVLTLRVASAVAANDPGMSVSGAAPEPLESPSTSDLAPSMEVAATPPSKAVVVTGLSFKQLRNDNKSRLIITTDSTSPEYTAREEGNNRFVVRIGNSKLANASLKRDINTKAFDTAIATISPRALPGATEFAVELGQQAPYTITQSGKDIFVDVDIPVRQTSEDGAAIPLAKAEPTPTPAPAPVSKEPSPLTEDETIVSSPPKGDTGGATGRSYRYVKEEFMNDTLSDGEPLSRMAAILAGSVDGKKFAGRRISLDFKDAEVRSVFRLIADISRFNIIISDDVDGRITIRLDDVPWDQAFAIILQTRGLWFEKYGNIIRVASSDKLKKERESAAAAAAAAKAAKPLDVLFKPVSFAEAGTLTKQIQSVLSDRGTVDIDSRTNTLIIKDIREHLDKAKRLVDILDTQTPQVTIESRIVEATSTFTRSFGINWSGNARFTSATGNPTGVFFPNNASISPFALNFPVEAGFINSTANISLGSINNIIDLDLALALGEQEGHSKLISAPKVTVLDNKSATITAGSQIPFVTQTSNAGSNVRFESAATTLNVTPHITNDGSILMTIAANRNEPNFAQLVQGNPIIDQRSANTEVLVKSGNTTVIGGIYSTQSARSQSRFPVLHQIPLLGALFKNYNKAIRRTELLIFVTPRIVGDEREAIREVSE